MRMPILWVLLGCALTAHAQNVPMGPVFPVSGGGGSNTWTLVSAPTTFSCAASPCTITTTIGAGHVGHFWLSTFNATDYITGVTGGGTWVEPTSCQLSANSASESCAYNLNTSSASSVSVAYTTSDAAKVIYAEYSFSGASATFDGCATNNDSTSTTSPLGATLTPTGTSDLAIQFISAGFQVSAISAGYTLETHDTTGVANAQALNVSSVPQPTWTIIAAATANAGVCAFK